MRTVESTAQAQAPKARKPTTQRKTSRTVSSVYKERARLNKDRFLELFRILVGKEDCGKFAEPFGVSRATTINWTKDCDDETATSPKGDALRDALAKIGVKENVFFTEDDAIWKNYLGIFRNERNEKVQNLLDSDNKIKRPDWLLFSSNMTRRQRLINERTTEIILTSSARDINDFLMENMEMFEKNLVEKEVFYLLVLPAGAGEFESTKTQVLVKDLRRKLRKSVNEFDEVRGTIDVVSVNRNHSADWSWIDYVSILVGENCREGILGKKLDLSASDVQECYEQVYRAGDGISNDIESSGFVWIKAPRRRELSYVQLINKWAMDAEWPIKDLS